MGKAKRLRKARMKHKRDVRNRKARERSYSLYHGLIKKYLTPSIRNRLLNPNCNTIIKWARIFQQRGQNDRL